MLSYLGEVIQAGDSLNYPSILYRVEEIGKTSRDASIKNVAIEILLNQRELARHLKLQIKTEAMLDGAHHIADTIVKKREVPPIGSYVLRNNNDRPSSLPTIFIVSAVVSSVLLFAGLLLRAH